MTLGSCSWIYYRNGRLTTSRPWHWELTDLAYRLQRKRDHAHTYEESAHWDRLAHRAWELTPHHWFYSPTCAERAWQRYLAAEVAHG